VTRERPLSDCVELLFARRYVLSPSAEVALEDYARALARATAAEALGDGEDPQRLRGVHLCAPATAPGAVVREDIEAFAGELAEGAGSGLGWS
jgi:hypothetical protein